MLTGKISNSADQGINSVQNLETKHGQMEFHQEFMKTDREINFRVLDAVHGEENHEPELPKFVAQQYN